MRYFVLMFMMGAAVIWAEPSVYGNTSSGSTKKNQRAIFALQTQVAQLKQEIEGLRSIVEGLGQTLNAQKQKEAASGVDGGEDLSHLRALVEKINKNYVSRAEFSRKTTEVKNTKHKQEKRRQEKSTKHSPQKADAGLASASSAALYSRGVRLAKKKKYAMAKLRFDILKKRGYKKASTNFYLGEIAYRTKNYSDAIGFYKQSAAINENANYMDTLLLHTGISLEKRGEKKQAKRFFQAIVDGYPETGSATVAKRHLR